MPDAGEYFDLGGFEHRTLFQPGQPVWAALDRLGDYLASLFEGPSPLADHTGFVERTLVILDGQVRVLEGDQPAEGAAVIMAGAHIQDHRVIVGPGTVVEPGAMIKGPSVFGRDCEIRQGAYVRGNVLTGDGCVVGHASEAKGSILLDGAKAAHFAYVGDSILGRDVNLGAGTKLANLRMVPGTVRIGTGKSRIDTGRRKLGAILGDGTETGCNSTTAPGTLMGPGSVVYAGVSVPAGDHAGRTFFTPAKGSVVIRSLGR